MAVDFPLVLYDCHFDGLSWHRDDDELNHAMATLQQHWTQGAIKANVIHGMIQGLEVLGETFIKTQLSPPSPIPHIIIRGCS